jgi:hypothetical protein
MLQNSPMLDNRSEEAEDTERDKTQSENQGAMKVFGGQVREASGTYKTPPRLDGGEI